ncbi:MAG TPA: cytochrome c oxidase subunit 3 family protein [Verrucomicrobiae bacterium]|nr:cytochrome c oxidase subunit 3 family protein [Verrucomicrobiae bacterium]
MAERSDYLAHQFVDPIQQEQSSTLGMWVFLATEVLFFGGLFAAYTVYRFQFPEVFQHASHHLSVLLGTINTGVLLTSSLTMALAIHSAQTGHRRQLMAFLIITMVLGIGFMVVKGCEYHKDYVEHLVPGHSFAFDARYMPQAQMFFVLYFLMTGLHAVHVTVGIGVIGVFLILSLKGRFTPEYHTPLEIGGLYWHFVDIVWIFLYPLLYLVGHHR